MFTTVLLAGAVATASLTIHEVPGAGAPALQAPAPAGQVQSTVTAAQLAPFVGEWALALQGPNGPGAFALSIRTEGDKPQGDISSDQLPKRPIDAFSMADKTLLLPYSFTWEGNPVEAVVKLTPSPDGTMKAQIDFAGGAYIMDGTATKKDKAK
jgi:hypothetical protein